MGCLNCIRHGFLIGLIWAMGLLFPLIHTATAAPNPITVGVYQNKPMIFLDEKGEVQGLYKEVIEIIAQREGWNIEYRYGTWSELLEQLQKGELDLLGAIAYTPARDRTMDFSKESFFVNWGQVFTRQTGSIQSFPDLDGKKVGGLKGDIYAIKFMELVKKFDINVQMQMFDSYNYVLDAVQKGDIDAGVVNRLVGSVQSRRFHVSATPIVFNPVEVTLAVPEGKHGMLLATLEANLAAMKANKSSAFYEVFNRWLGGEKKKSMLPPWITQAFWVVVGIIIALLLLNFLLNRKVHSRTVRLKQEVAERQEAERALQRAHDDLERRVLDRTQELEVSELRFRNLFNASLVPLFRTPVEGGRVILANPALVQMFGFESVEEMIALHDPISSYADPKVRARFIEILQRDGRVESFDSELIRADGSHFFAEMSAILYPEADYLEGSIIDVTQRKRTERALLQAKQSAERANRAKSEFLATLSHEIRTPLNGIIGLLSALQESKLDLKQKEQVTLISRSSNLLLDLLNDILDFSKIEAGQLVLEQVPFQPLEMMADVCACLSENAAQKGVVLSHQTQGWIPPALLGDAVRIRQILLNLTNNAVKFTHQGEVAVHLWGLDDEPEILPAWVSLRFEVVDTGVGIAAADLERVFDPFCQADSAVNRHHSGTGLGLSICKRLVEVMGGEMWAESQEGQGSTFRFTLSLPPVELKPEQLEGAIDPDDVFPMRVLLVEDDPVNQMVAVELLESAGHKVDVAENGATGLVKAQEASYDLILMDIRMPGMDGITATRMLREFETAEGKGRVPILGLTADTLKDTLLACREAGMDDVLTKPVRVHVLAQRVASLGLDNQ
ncbi:ATP-binding protein [Magnetococcus sp. PR-3]|uniref:ATP-binding protein n=1 Tax=Magnetococcus sp. PR-3 TaxID=3120355 RepID=UPI002FCE48E0